MLGCLPSRYEIEHSVLRASAARPAIIGAGVLLSLAKFGRSDPRYDARVECSEPLLNFALCPVTTMCTACSLLREACFVVRSHPMWQSDGRCLWYSVTVRGGVWRALGYGVRSATPCVHAVRHQGTAARASQSVLRAVRPQLSTMPHGGVRRRVHLVRADVAAMYALAAT
eukprot:COSAG01_NODE_622_length_14779_cov_69.589305_9_plen_170_part_00